jgi:hypothetical protein
MNTLLQKKKHSYDADSLTCSALSCSTLIALKSSLLSQFCSAKNNMLSRYRIDRGLLAGEEPIHGGGHGLHVDQMGDPLTGSALSFSTLISQSLFCVAKKHTFRCRQGSPDR